jgi:hypothetical protein
MDALENRKKKKKKKKKKKSRQLHFILNFQVHIIVHVLYVANTRIYTKEFQNEMERIMQQKRLPAFNLVGVRIYSFFFFFLF